MQETIQRVIKAEAAAILSIPETNDFSRAIEVIFNQVHQRRAKVITSGIGKAGQVAHNLASTLSSTGTPAVFMHPSEAQHGDLGLVHPEDCYILISNSGRTRELLELIALTRNLHGQSLPLLVITGSAQSPLAQAADVLLHTGGPKEVCPLELTPTTSITAMQVIGHILTVLLIEKTGFTREGFLKRHHGGYLGSKLKQEKGD